MPIRRRCFVSEARRAKANKTRVSEGQEGRSERPEGRRLTAPSALYSTVTLFARFLGLSTSQPRKTATW